MYPELQNKLNYNVANYVMNYPVMNFLHFVYLLIYLQTKIKEDCLQENAKWKYQKMELCAI